MKLHAPGGRTHTPFPRCVFNLAEAADNYHKDAFLFAAGYHAVWVGGFFHQMPVHSGSKTSSPRV